jgi:hypothetical protein
MHLRHETKTISLLLNVPQSPILIRYGGLKAKELSKTRDVQQLFRDHIFSINAKDADKDLSDDAVTSNTQLPGLPGKEVPTLKPSESQSSLLSPEEEAEEAEFRRKYLEDLERAEKLRQQAQERVKSYSAAQEEERKKLQEKSQREAQSLQQLKSTLAKEGNSTGPFFQQWLTYQAPNSIMWKRKYATIQDRTLSLYIDESQENATLSLKLSGASIRDSEDETGMRDSFTVTMEGKEYSFYADNHDDFLKAHAAIELSLSL